MEYLDENGKRIYSNETMRLLKQYIDTKQLKSSVEGYNNTLERIGIFLSDKRLRTEEEKIDDQLGKDLLAW